MIVSISNIYSSAKKYFKVIAEILLIYIFTFSIFWIFKNTGYTPIYTITLIISISISSLLNTILVYVIHYF